jgi:prepilin signal peptidase PulO-like enzyme (type II secretory pathway)
LADLPELTQAISPRLGAVWLLAALLFLTTAAALFVWPRGWWAIGACAIVVSMFVSVPSWADAKFGALANLVALIGVVFGFLAQGPVSLRAYDRDVARALVRVAPSGRVSRTRATRFEPSCRSTRPVS